ncbi:hypothetical protein PENSPDRAFT_652134 [Peniophora sp. CONT]|nr:hypothetical protein PENSPDRAFT_652134 [Peniophora sp. CONT]
MLAAIFVFLCCRRRRRRRVQEEAPILESPARFVPEPYALRLDDTDTSRRGLLLDSGGAPLSKRSLAATASSTQVHSKGLGLDTGSETIALTELTSDVERDREESTTDREMREAEDAEAHDAFIERIPTRYLARILHERVTGAAPGDEDDFEWRLGGADGVTSPPSYRSGSVHQG